MNRLFPANSRVCFLGDSITANGLWIAHSLDEYVAKRPDDRVTFYNCGIAGGTAVSGLKYLEDMVFPLEPTHAVIMYGMNDVYRSLYGLSESPEVADQREQALVHYRDNLSRLADLLTGRGISLIFCSTTPYDEGQQSETENLFGCAAALKTLSSITEQIAAGYHCDYIDFNTPMSRINAELQQINPRLSLVSEDRVHPTDTGYYTIAALFLRYLGIVEVEAPTAVGISNGYTVKPLSDIGHERYLTDVALRQIWAVEWLLLQQIAKHPVEVKIDFVKDYLTYGKAATPYFRSIAENYLMNKPKEKQLLEKLHALTKVLYA